MADETPQAPPITQQDVRLYLGGLTSYVEQISMDADVYGSVIADTIAAFERETRVLLTNKLIRTNPGPDDTYDIRDDAYAVRGISKMRLIRVALRFKPMTALLSVRLEFNRQNRIISFPEDWQRVNMRLSVLTIIPYGTSAPFSPMAGMAVMLPMLGGMGFPGDVIPALLALDYRAGYPDTATAAEHADVRGYLARQSARHLLVAMRGLVPNSQTLDGFTQNFDTVQQRLDSMAADDDKFLKMFKHAETPIKAGVI